MLNLPNTGLPGERRITPFDLRILNIVRQSAEGTSTTITLAQIGLKLNTHRQMVHRGMKRLVEAGIVTRQRMGRGCATTVIRDDNGMTIGMTIAPERRDDNHNSLICNDNQLPRSVRDDNGMTVDPVRDDNGMTIGSARDDNHKPLKKQRNRVFGIIRDGAGMTIGMTIPTDAEGGKRVLPPHKEKSVSLPPKKKGLPHTPSKEKLPPTHPKKKLPPPHSEKSAPRSGEDTTMETTTTVEASGELAGEQILVSPSPPVGLSGPAPGEGLSAYLRRTAPADPKINGVHADWAFHAFRLRAKQLNLPVPRPTGLTPGRKQLLQARLREHGIDGWMAALKNLEAPFLRGDNDRGWQANLDFVLQASSFCKLVENAYKGKTVGYSYV